MARSAGSSTIAQFYCGVDGIIQGSKWGNPTHNTYYVFQIDDIDLDGTWTMSAGGSSCTSFQTYSKLQKTEIGYEVTYDNNSIFTNDLKNLKTYRSGSWILWSSADGTHNDRELPSRPPWFLNHCDSGSWSHVQDGQQTSPPSGCV